SLALMDLLDKAAQHNPDLLAVGINKRLAELELKTIKSQRYPTIRLNGGYNFSESASSLGFVAQSNSRGLNYGITASLNIFDGINQRRNEFIAKLQLVNVDVMVQQQRSQVEATLSQAYQTYHTNMRLARLEEINLQIAKQILDITLDKF